ncbi:MAG TPA: hypothetical protein VIG07_14480 [Methylomirabilota bacterium]|jgi:hypothetical protein
MKKISTPYTFSFKIFPFLFFGFLVVIFSLMLMAGALKETPMLVVVPCAMAAIGYFLMKMVLGNLVDEVYDCDDFLLVRKGGAEERIPLSDIINVNFAMNQRPARITLTLASPGKFGREISFSPPPEIHLNPFLRNEIAEELIARAHKARSEHH